MTWELLFLETDMTLLTGFTLYIRSSAYHMIRFTVSFVNLFSVAILVCGSERKKKCSLKNKKNVYESVIIITSFFATH